MGFLSANIALYKLRNKTLVKVFNDLGAQLPSEIQRGNLLKSLLTTAYTILKIT